MAIRKCKTCVNYKEGEPKKVKYVESYLTSKDKNSSGVYIKNPSEIILFITAIPIIGTLLIMIYWILRDVEYRRR